MSRDVALISGDDWQAIYVDGELVDQGHSIDWMYVIGQLGCNTYNYTANNKWLESEGHFPEDMNEVVYAN